MVMLAPENDRDVGGCKAEEPSKGISAEPRRQRKIIHIDMDAFYASVEQRDNPSCGESRSPSADHASAASSRPQAMRRGDSACAPRCRRSPPSANAPSLIFVKPRFDVYKAVSLQIRAIFAEYTPLIEPLSLDEAYLDVTENLQGDRFGDRYRRGDPGEDPRRDRAHCLRRRLLQQIPRQARLGSSQARWPLRHHAEDGAGLRRGSACREIPWRRTRDDGEDEPARHQNRARP